MARGTVPTLQSSKEHIIIAEGFLHKMPDLGEDSRKDLITLIKDVGNPKKLKACLKDQEALPMGMFSSFVSSVKSLFVSKDPTSDIIDAAIAQSRRTKDWEFLATLQEKLYNEPFLEHLAQDFIAGASRHFQESMKLFLPRLYSQAYNIKQQAIHRQVEAEANSQDQKRRASARAKLFNEVKVAQAQVDPEYVIY